MPAIVEYRFQLHGEIAIDLEAMLRDAPGFRGVPMIHRTFDFVADWGAHDRYGTIDAWAGLRGDCIHVYVRDGATGVDAVIGYIECRLAAAHVTFSLHGPDAVDAVAFF